MALISSDFMGSGSENESQTRADLSVHGNACGDSRPVQYPPKTNAHSIVFSLL
jgi:hypothetical protein